MLSLFAYPTSWPKIWQPQYPPCNFPFLAHFSIVKVPWALWKWRAHAWKKIGPSPSARHKRCGCFFSYGRTGWYLSQWNVGNVGNVLPITVVNGFWPKHFGLLGQWVVGSNSHHLIPNPVSSCSNLLHWSVLTGQWHAPWHGKSQFNQFNHPKFQKGHSGKYSKSLWYQTGGGMSSIMGGKLWIS